MTRLLLLTLLLGALTGCGEYREPRANCFDFVAATEDEEPCEFFEFGRLDKVPAIDA